METKLNIHEIELRIAQYFGIRENIIVPNVSWGYFKTHEADMVILTKSGYITEVEIKRSLEDLKADFKKHTNHYEGKVEQLFYAVPVGIADKAWKIIEQSFEGNPVKCGMLVYDEGGGVGVYMPAPSISMMQRKNKQDNRLFLEEQNRLIRLGVMRYWSLVQRVIDNHKQQQSLI